MKRIIKQQYCSSSSSIIQRHKNKSSKSSSWSDIGVDLLIEINKKLCNYGDHIRFRGVCKSWRAVGHDIVKRAGDVLPWLTVLHIYHNMKKLSYKLYEPLDPIKPHTTTTASTITSISHTINLGDYFDDDISHMYYYRYRYVDGWLHITVYFHKSKSFSFLFFSLATKSSFTLPQLNVSTLVLLYLGLSTTPDSPDCVFLALCLTNEFTRTIGIFRHGDTHWSTTQSVGGWFGKPEHITVVFIRGVFYFFFDVGIGSYDLATGILKVDPYSTLLQFSGIHSFFGLDGDLMLAYYEPETTPKFCIRKYDWSSKVWVPLQSLAGRSLYLTSCSVYVDHINYYGISGANKIYVREDTSAYVKKFTLEDGQLLKCPSTGCRNWGGPSSCIALDIWVDPPDVLLRKG